MVAWSLPGSIESIVGATGVPGITRPLAEAAPAPSPLTALRVMEYAAPLLSPVIVMGLVEVAGAKAV